MPKHVKSISSAPEPLYPWQKLPRGVTTIGVIDPCYGSSHVIYGLGTPNYRHRTLQTLPLKRLDGRVTFFKFTPFILDWSIPLIHTWNAVPLNRDFIVSFELELPRYLHGPSDAQVRRGMEILASSRCKKILALSEFARQYAVRRFEQFGMPHIAEKMVLFRGAVPDPLSSSDPVGSRADHASFAAKPLSAAVIGTHLFHKGGMHAILAFERLRARGFNVTLTLIGDFESKNSAFGEGIPNPVEWRARALSHDWIRFTGPVPNSQVFTELREHDICIYTSLDESLGWLPIEAAILGVPVIGTAVCALPELVGHRTTGWLIEMPLREDGRWSGLELTGPAKLAALEEANELIVAGIDDCITAIYGDPSLLVSWGTAGREWAKSHYGMAAASEKLERIYDAVLAVD
jgi:glycosyltransferase involved in cell wall biosynthesis